MSSVSLHGSGSCVFNFDRWIAQNNHNSFAFLLSLSVSAAYSGSGLQLKYRIAHYLWPAWWSSGVVVVGDKRWPLAERKQDFEAAK